jgi:cell wall-associated NlpC family hydrolase
MPTTSNYVPKHRAVKQRVLNDWKRLTALGATLPAAVGSVAALAPTAQAGAERREEQIRHAVQIARDQKADLYEYGSDGPEQFDCSGLTQFVFERAGIDLPRTSDEQADSGRRIKKSNMRPGDLMAFTDGGDVYHIAVYTGHTQNGKPRMIEAGNEDTEVRSTGAWSSEWYGVTLRR